MYPSIPMKLQDYHQDGYKLVGTETPIAILLVLLGKFYHVTTRRDVPGSTITLFDLPQLTTFFWIGRVHTYFRLFFRMSPTLSGGPSHDRKLWTLNVVGWKLF